MGEKDTRITMDGDNSIPPPYSEAQPPLPTTYSTSNAQPPRSYNQTPRKLTLDKTFLYSLDSLLLITEGVLSMVAFICAAADERFARYGGGWIIFVGLTTFVCQLILFVMYLFRYIYSLPSYIPFPVVELIYFGLASLFFFISGIVAAIEWHWSDAVRACTVFCWFALVAYVLDTYRKFVAWRNQNEAEGPNTVSSGGMDPASTIGPPSITTQPTY